MAKSGAQEMGDLGHGMFEAGRARLRAALSRLIRTGHKQGRNPRNPHFLRIRVFHFTALTTSLFLASFFGLLSVKVYTDYDAELSRSERTADNLAAMNAAQLESTFNNVETLLTLLDEASISVGTIALQNLARAIEQKSASVHRIIIVDTYGAPVDRTGLAVTTSEAAALNLAATSNWGRFANKAGPVSRLMARLTRLRITKAISRYPTPWQTMTAKKDGPWPLSRPRNCPS